MHAVRRSINTKMVLRCSCIISFAGILSTDHHDVFVRSSLFVRSPCNLTLSKLIRASFISALRLLGGSGGVVNSLDFCPASLKSLGCFYFRCALSSRQWKAVTVNFTLPTLKTFLEARSQNVSGNKQ